MHYILDCYTDEPSGLGVPPYLGTYPRYLYGYFRDKGIPVKYSTIDDLRLKFYPQAEEINRKTNIRIYNRTGADFSDCDMLIIILGVHVPGKYLSALPGTLKEIMQLTKELRCKKILTGPALFGTQLEGGKIQEQIRDDFEHEQYDFSIKEINKYSIKGAELIAQLPERIAEIETGRGCPSGKCSFCTEPIKHRFEKRKKEDVLKEVCELYRHGTRYFRLGKQSDFYSIDDPAWLLRSIREKCPDIKVLHIDNANPVSVVAYPEITKAIIKYCTPGNVAAFGVESFDPDVVKKNNLNCTAEIAFKAILQLNELGREKGDNGMPAFLPGLNIIFGLNGESKKTHEHNMNALNHIREKGWLLRRINIRQVSVFEGTAMQETGVKYLNKNKKYYWKWRNEIRQKIDYPLLKELVPTGTVLKDVFSEIYDGNTTFARQIGTYPLIVGIKKRIALKENYSVKITGHMLRSVVGEVV